MLLRHLHFVLLHCRRRECCQCIQRWCRRRRRCEYRLSIPRI